MLILVFWGIVFAACQGENPETTKCGDDLAPLELSAQSTVSSDPLADAGLKGQSGCTLD